MAELLRSNQIRNGAKRYKRRKVTDNRDYKVLYRFTKENVEWITHYFYGDDNLDTTGGAVSNEIKMKCFLRYVGDPGFQSRIGEDLGIHQSTVSKIIIEVSNKIYERTNEWLKFPQTNNEELGNAKHHC
ncbi:hypothetical protein QE152_g10902 [Popillia japonica]|uniref:Transposase Helix-turn-helix domain-containing protein n=1 Tax=Popillia japonica TaxID=7064 RepID=A0AAW1LP24_POPJA